MKKSILLLFFIAFQTITAQLLLLPEKAKDVNPLNVGEKIPNTTITLSNKGEVKTQELFKEKQTILIIYRGGWCPFCNRQLSGLTKIKDELVGLGYQIVAVSPDDISNKKSKKYARNYIIGSDSKTELIRKLGIAYQAPEKLLDILLKHSKGTNKNIIPAPSVFILNKESNIVYKNVSKNFKKRINPELLLAVAGTYKE